MQLFQYPPSTEQVAAEGRIGYEIDRIEAGNGIHTYIQGVDFPFKGNPTPGAINAINLVKRSLIETLKLFWPLVPFRSPRRLILAFNRITWPYISEHLLLPQYQQPITRELIVFIETFLEGYGQIANVTSTERSNSLSLFANIVAHIVEYDAAYRIRLHDMFQETTKERLSQRKELKRLLKLYAERDDPRVASKILFLGNLLSYSLLIPAINKRYKKALNTITYSNLLPDHADLYWASKRTDYKANTKALYGNH
jgi:hypothetical protein